MVTPDPSLRLDEVGIPYSIARKLTIPERVASFNIERYAIFFSFLLGFFCKTKGREEGEALPS